MATTYGLEQDFLDHLKGNKVLGMNGIGADVSCPFIPFHVLREYWTETRIKEFLGACGVSTIGWRTVQRSYLKVLSTLVVIREGAWIGLFLKNGVDDVRFPFFPLAHPPHFLAGVPFLNSFYTAQWQFWALDFETEVLMHDRKLEKEQILPIIEKKTLKEGRGSSGATSLVVLHEDYNHLFDQSHGSNLPTSHKFVLKTYTSELDAAKKYYTKEVENFKNLMRPEKVEENIITFHGSWQQGDTFNLLLEYADMGSLSGYFQNTPPPQEGKDIMLFWKSFLGVVMGLCRIHELRVDDQSTEVRKSVLKGIHQDVKPSNILVCSKPGSGPYDVVCKLADLGLSHFTAVMEDKDTGCIDQYGSLTYSAPECCRVNTFLERSDLLVNPTIDIWSLGCVFSEALVWAVYGEERLAKYRTLRSTEIDQVNGLKEAGYGTCFHNGREMLSAVATMLKNACNDRRHHDYVSEALARMIERMLQPPQYRLDAMQVYNECQQVLRGAEEKLSRKAPRESFPEVFQTRPNEVLSPPDQSGIPQTPPESPIGCGLGFSVMDSIISNDNSDIGGSPLSSPLSNGAGADRPPVATYLHGSAPKPDEPSQRPTLLTSNPPSSSGHTKPPSTSVQRVHFWMQDKKEKSPASLDGLDCAGALADRDHVFLIDDSSSMKPYRNDLVHVFHALAYIVKTKDPDGLDLKFTNSPDWHHNDDTTPLVKKVKAMSPHGQCSMKAALDHVLQKFSPATKGPRSKPTHRARKSLSFLGPTQRKEKIGLSIYVFTDGVWEQGPGEVCGVEETIGLAVERLRKSGHLDYRLGIQFIQFGEDPIGSRRLHLLDCHLNEKWGIDMDVVDTEQYNGNVWKMLLGAINRYWDNDQEENPTKTCETCLRIHAPRSPTNQSPYQNTNLVLEKNTYN